VKTESPRRKIKSSNGAEASARPAMASLPLELGTPQPRDKAELVSVLMFEVGGAAYAIGVENTEGVVDCPRITPLPGPPDGVAGLTSVRGRMTVVLDLGTRASEAPAKQRLILVKGDAQLGLLADRVEGVVALEPRKVRPVAHGKSRLTQQGAKFGGPATSYFKSGARRVPIIDVDRLCEA
jgi:purine-binding chemotaxis protein CheW